MDQTWSRSANTARRAIREDNYLVKSRPCQLSTRLCKSTATLSMSSCATASSSSSSSSLGGVGGRDTCTGSEIVEADFCSVCCSPNCGRIFVSGTSMEMRHVRLCCCLDHVRVGYSLRTCKIGAAIGLRGMTERVAVGGTVVSIELSCSCLLLGMVLGATGDAATVFIVPLLPSRL